MPPKRACPRNAPFPTTNAGQARSRHLRCASGYRYLTQTRHQTAAARPARLPNARRFYRHAIWLIAFLVAAHTACFIASVVMIDGQEQDITEVRGGARGRGLRGGRGVSDMGATGP